MYNYKKIVSLLMIFILTLTMGNLVLANDSDSFYKKQKISIDKYNKLVENFKYENAFLYNDIYNSFYAYFVWQKFSQLLHYL